MHEHRKPKSHPGRQDGDPFVLPPGHHMELAGHHWLRVLDYDGHHFGTVVLQWQPQARKWCHSGDVATGRHVENVEYYQYVAPCPMPPLPDELKKLKRLVDRPIHSADDVSFFRKLLRGWVV